MRFFPNNFISPSEVANSEMRNNVSFKSHLSQALYFIRGIAIVFVIIGHVIGDDKNNGMRKMYSSDIVGLTWLSDFIYTFHMPVFLMVSGVAFAVFSNKNISYLEFMQSKLKRILLPLICWAPPFFLFHSLSQGKQFSFIDIIKAVIFPYSMFWFLHALIFASIFSFCFFKFFKSPYLYLLISIFLFFISLFFQELFISFYFHFNIFYALGVFIAHYLPQIHLVLGRLSLIFISVISSFCILTMIAVKQFMVANYQSIIPIINGIIAFAFLYIAIDTYKIRFSFKSKNQILQFIKNNILYAGKMSMVIYLFHMYFATITRIFLVKGFSSTEPSLHFILGCSTAYLGPIILYKLLQKRSRAFRYSIGEG